MDASICIRRWRVAAASAALCFVQISHAQLAPPSGRSPTPRAATLNPPKYALASRNGASLTLSWTQFLYLPTHAPAANHFVVCLFESATQDCSTTALRWTVAANATTRSAVMSSVVGGMPQIIGYTYTFELPLTVAAPRRDRQLQWTIGSCATTWQGSCTFATPGNLRLATGSPHISPLADEPP